MTNQFKDVVTVREGDADGNRMVVRLTTEQGRRIHAIGVPQDNDSRTGPTWAYLFENDGMTLIDAGATGSYQHLTDGVEATGFQMRDVERVIITHGHQDHDGAAGQLAEEAGAEIWAHEMYTHLLQYNPWDIQRNPSSPLQREMERVVTADRASTAGDSARQSAGYAERQKRHVEIRRKFEVSRSLQDDDSAGDLRFIYAPGHSPDEICVTLDGLVFTGDHVLPEITPHPTTKARFSAPIRKSVPQRYHCEDKIYGLETYLRSLRMIANLGDDVAVMPAHRLVQQGAVQLRDGGAGGGYPAASRGPAGADSAQVGDGADVAGAYHARGVRAAQADRGQPVYGAVGDCCAYRTAGRYGGHRGVGGYADAVEGERELQGDDCGDVMSARGRREDAHDWQDFRAGYCGFISSMNSTIVLNW